MKKRILVVEDEGIVRKDISERLKALSYDVCAVSSGEEAVERCGDFAPDLVLMDVMLQKGIDGITAASRINERHCVPIIYLTAFADVNTIDRAKATNPYGYILKPFEERELRTNIEMALHRHSLELKLKESRQWFSATLTSIGEGVIATDAGGGIIFMNPISEKLTGWIEADARGRQFAEVFRVRGCEIAPGGAERVFDDVVLTDRAGKEIPVEVSVSPIRSDSEGSAGMVLVFRDITGQKQVRDQLMQSSKMAAIGTLAGGVAHEFNNLISIMRSKCELALMDNDPVAASQACQSVMIATERAQKIVQSLLGFSRRLKPSRENVELGGLLEETLFLIERELAKQHIRVVKDYSRLPPLMADAGQIQQVFLNILVNAKEAMPSGGTLSLRVYGSGGYHVAEIGDTGPGIPPELVERIFEPFFTTKTASPRGSTGGNGLGLALSLGIIENHGGQIRVSTGEHGTCFTVRLPETGAQNKE